MPKRQFVQYPGSKDQNVCTPRRSQLLNFEFEIVSNQYETIQYKTNTIKQLNENHIEMTAAAVWLLALSC